jgi:hypothetical protein
MRVHLDVLGWLHALAGAFGVLTGASLLVLAAGTFLAAGALGARAGSVGTVAWTLAVCGLVFLVGGALMVAAGRAVLARRPGGRPAALWLAVANLCVIPFGTALGVYTFWALLNDDARRAFGRRPRAPFDAE